MAIVRRERLEDGTFGPPEKIGQGETDVEKVKRLEMENALSVLDRAQQEARLNVLEQDNSALLLEIAQFKGGL